MYNIEVPETINKIIAVLNRFGIWRNEDESVYCKWPRWSIYILLQETFLLSLALGALRSDSMAESVLLASLVLICSILHVKMVYLILRESEIRQFIHDMGIYTIEDREEFLLASKKLGRLMHFAQLFVGIVFLDAFCLFIFPLISNRRSLPLNMSFPLNWKESQFGFFVTYAYMVSVVLLNCLSTLLNIFIWFIMMNCSIQYRNLGANFRNSGSIKTNTNSMQLCQQRGQVSEAERQKYFLQELIGSIETHRNIKEKVNRFTECFSNLLLVHISTIGICMCGSVYVLAFSTNESLVISVFNILILIYNIFDIFMVMYFANEIMLESDRLSYSLFQSNWFDEPKLTKKNVIILTEVLKRPQVMIIYQLYRMNLQTFTSILKFSYSVFNILKSFQ